MNGCHEIVNWSPSLTTVSSLGSVALPSPSFEGLPSSKEEQMLRNAFYTKFVLLLLVLAAAAWILGNEPWGPG